MEYFVPCVTEPGKWQCVAFVPAIAARFAVAMLHRLRSCHRQYRGNQSVKIPQWSEPQSGVVIVMERGKYAVMKSWCKIPYNSAQK